MTDGIVATVAAREAAAVAACPGSFAELYAAQLPALARYAYQLTRDADLARDLAQEAFTRLLARWVGVREPRPYLYHTVYNLVCDVWQRGRRERSALGTLGRAADRDVAAPDRTVRDAVERLPAGHREAVLLFYYADLPLTEVAAATGRPVGTVKWLLADARERLARSLGASDD